MLLGLVIVAMLAVTDALLLWLGRRFGAYTENQQKIERERLEAQREFIASNSLMHASLINALSTIARIRKDGGNLPPEERAAPFTSEENVTDDPIHRVSGGTNG